jgi:lysophospholipase L1-like esterase
MPVQIARSLVVNDNVPAVHLYGQSGARAVSFVLPLQWLDSLRPSICLLELGTNDLAAAVKVEDVANALLYLASLLQARFNCVVGILSVIPRYEGLAVPQSVFRENVRRLETVLKHETKRTPLMFFHKHKGFWESQGPDGIKYLQHFEDLSMDGIHPNSVLGRQKYKNSLRSALSKAIFMCKQF